MSKIFITGGAGFIGSRLVETLKEEENAELNILLRSISRAARISRYPLNYFQGTITDAAVLDNAISGCDTVIHCAHDFSSDEANIQAADIISRMCLKHHVKRLVYISTSSVHLCNDQSVINETSPLNKSWSYPANKLKVEERFLSFFRDLRLPVIILRPSVIYGPFAGVWTNGIVRDMMESRIILPFEGNRICNAVYIDDVVLAIRKAMESPAEANGRAFLVSGKEELTWKDFLGAYAKYPGTQEPVLWSEKESIEWYERLKTEKTTTIKPTLGKDPISFMKSNFLYTLYRFLLRNDFLKEKLLSAKTKIPKPLKYPSPESYETLGCTGQIDFSNAKTVINYHPAVDFNTGMNKTMLYLNWYNLHAN